MLEQAASVAPPAYASKSSGSVENAVKLVQGLLRTLKVCLERRLKHRIPAEHAIMASLVQHAAWLLTVQSRGPDGRTAYERLRGKAWSKRMACFGEVCLAKMGKHELGKEEGSQARCEVVQGRFLGVRPRLQRIRFAHPGPTGEDQGHTADHCWKPLEQRRLDAAFEFLFPLEL